MATSIRTRPTRNKAQPAGPEGSTGGAFAAAPLGATTTAQDGHLDPGRTGVVFVHGIGTQPACETFLEWSGSVVDLLADWRTGHGFGEDPVLHCDYDLSGTRLPILELEVPEYDGHPAATWVLTEAWWAATTRSPGLGSMTAYVRHALPGIMDGIRQSYRQRTDLWAKKRGQVRAFAKTSDGYAHSQLVLAAVSGHRTDWVDVLDRIQK